MRLPARLLETKFNACKDKLSGRVQTSLDGGAHNLWKTMLYLCTEHHFAPDALVVDIEGTETVWIDQGFKSAGYQNHVMAFTR